MRVAGQIIEKEVVDSSGMISGKVKDVELNWSENKIGAVVLENGSISESICLSNEENVIPYIGLNILGIR